MMRHGGHLCAASGWAMAVGATYGDGVAVCPRCESDIATTTVSRPGGRVRIIPRHPAPPATADAITQERYGTARKAAAQ